MIAGVRGGEGWSSNKNAPIATKGFTKTHNTVKGKLTRIDGDFSRSMTSRFTEGIR